MEQEQIDKEILRLVEQKPEITNQDLAQSLAIPENMVKERLQRLSDTRQKILIVDDEFDALTALKRALESDNYNVVEAADGLSAIKKVKTEKPDIVLLDLMMPEIDGFEVLKRLKSDPLYKHVPIIMLTAKGEINDKIEGIEIGADDYVTKPFNLNEIRARIKMVLRRLQN
jgi:two-component system alkaline phosphatase synthesis response regulator PhoP